MRLPSRTFLQGIGALLALGILLFGLAAVEKREAAAAAFFSEALAEASVTERVSIDGTFYDIQNGVVGGNPSPAIRFRALRTAYALALARRSPLFDIAGVDPEALLKNTRRLEEDTRSILAKNQTSAHDASLVKNDLYPFEYLEALADLKRAHDQFVYSGSDRDAAAYERSLAATRAAGTRDFEQFERAFGAVVGSEPFRLLTLGGALTNESMRNSLAAIDERFAENARAFEDRTGCLEGTTRLCRTEDLSLTLPSPVSMNSDTGHLTFAAELPVNTTSTDVYPVLAKSACLALYPGPFVFAYNPAGISRMPLRYSRNAYFTPTAHTDGPILTYLKTHFDIDYSLRNPLSFYVCPDVLKDIGGSYAILQTVQFAKSHPSYAPAARSALLASRTYRESDAIEYVRRAAEDIRHDSSAAPMADLETLLALWREQSAGLDMLVAAMANVIEQDEMLRLQGVPFEKSARTLFLAYSAYPSLFLAYNPSTGTAPVTLHQTTPEDRHRIEDGVISYSELVRTVSPEKILHDIEALYAFEGLLP